MPLVSVVIPAYNCAPFIGETIRGIVEQSVKDVEIVVVDDGSTDETAATASDSSHAVQVIRQDNSGVCAARNRGIEAAKGTFVALLDHDDYWMPDKLANQLAAFANHPEVDVVFTDFVWWRPEETTGVFPAPENFRTRAEAQGIDPEFSGWIYHQMLLDSQVLTSTALVRAEIMAASGGFDESLPFSEDWDFWLRLSRRSQFLKLRESTTLYRQHPQQGSRLVREIDYRTRLLENATRRWGLCSPDGRCVTPARFNRQLAKYSAAFGRDHLRNEIGADRKIAAKSFLKSLAIDPTYWRAVAYLAAMAFGWQSK
jgi:GT2 family glycosyltransferase